MTWAERLVADLSQYKREGVPFDLAWTTAIKRHPPQGRDVGEPAEDLFAWAEQRDREPTLVDWMRTACSDAWHGRRPELRHLPVLAEPGEVFPVADVPHSAGHNRNAAAA